MSLAKCTKWPTVLPDDDGIRPAGDPDKCLYCGQQVGNPHQFECVTVLSKTRYAVFMNGDRVGTWRREDPFSWTVYDREFHKNQSSWCADNAVDEIEWVSEEAEARVSNVLNKNSCACRVIEFRVDAIEDAGPFVEIRRNL